MEAKTRENEAKKESKVKDLEPKKDAKGGLIGMLRPGRGNTLRPGDPPTE